MGQEFCVPEKHGSNNGNGNSSFSKVIVREFDRLTDFPGLIIEFDKYWKEVHGEDINEIYTYQDEATGKMISINLIEANILKYLNEDKCECFVAEHKGKIVGFNFFNLVFDCVSAVRAIYIHPDYQKRGLLRRLILCDKYPNIRRIFSMTYKDREPENIRGSKKWRKKIHSYEDMNVWENTVEPFMTKAIKRRS